MRFLHPVAATRLFRPLLLSALALLSGPGCTHAYLQKEGPYAVESVEVLRDDCGLLASPEELWDGELFISGEVVHMRYGLMDTLLVGRFLEGSSEDDDAFSLDGTVANASVHASDGTECLMDQMVMHLEGTTQCATRFDGVLSVHYESRVQQTSCACQLQVRYRAVQSSSPCTSAP